MSKSQARVESEAAERYLIQLCKHFAHKIPATYEGNRGRIEFGVGVCTLNAETGVLVMEAESANDDDLARLEQVVASHLERFAFRDKPTIEWKRAAA